MSSGRSYTSWVARALTICLFATVFALQGGISSMASATDSWTPPALVINDPAGTPQDWYRLVYDGKTGYSYDPSGSPEIYNSKPIMTGGALSVTVYAKNPITGEIRPLTASFTDAAGTRAPNTVTLHTDQMVCGKLSSQSTWLPVTWSETYDGTGLTSNTPGAYFKADSEIELVKLQVANDGTDSSQHIRPDGSSIRLDLYDRSWVGLLPGWYTVIPYRLAEDRFEFLYEPAQVHQRLWVPPCGGALAPAGQVPPGGVVPDPGTLDPETSSTSATGKLRFLPKIDRVKVKAINLKVANRTTFKLKRPGVKKAMTILAPAGEIVVKKARALKAGKYVLKARIKKNGQWGYKSVAWLTVKR